MFDSQVATAAQVRALVAHLGRVDGSDHSQVERIEQITALEELKAAAAAAQARLSVAYADTTAANHAATGAANRDQGTAVGAEIALARRESPNRGSRHLGLARALVRELPHSMRLLSSGAVSEWRATILCRETAALSVDDRREVDRQLADALAGMSDRAVEHAARGLAAQLDAASVARRARRAVRERRVTIRPAPDTMTYVTALLPVAQGVAVYAALDQHARGITADGDERGHGQLMADTLVEQVTGQSTADAVPIEVQLVMPADTLAGAGDEPAEIPGHGPIAADAARSLLAASAQSEASMWFRRVYTSPEAQELVALDSRRRLFPPSLKRFLMLRDKRCRMPWCDALIRNYDHVQPAWRGGATEAANGEGLCAACNQAKEALGWSAEVLDDGLGRPSPHRVRWRTPTGHTYDSTAPPILESRRRALPTGSDLSPVEAALIRLLDAA
jgi:hypothetical protein